jgi:hypothetical protein
MSGSVWLLWFRPEDGSEEMLHTAFATEDEAELYRSKLTRPDLARVGRQAVFKTAQDLWDLEWDG